MLYSQKKKKKINFIFLRLDGGWVGDIKIYKDKIRNENVLLLCSLILFKYFHNFSWLLNCYLADFSPFCTTCASHFTKIFRKITSNKNKKSNDTNKLFNRVANIMNYEEKKKVEEKKKKTK